MNRRISIIGAALFLIAIGAGAARGYTAWGPRLGVTADPDQVHVGMHIDVGSFGEHVRFQPNMDMGFGDDIFLASLNGDVAYRFFSTWDAWSPYLGGGLALYFWNFDRDRDFPRDDTETDFGLNALMGIERGLSGGDRFFTEVKIGLVDSPDFKATVGWSFH